MPSNAEPDSPPLARLPVSRGRAFLRAVLSAGPGLFMALLSLRFIGGLSFTPTATSNRITEYSLTLVLLPVAAGGLLLTFSGLRWLVMVLWPGRLEIVADVDALTFHLGPMGSARYETRRLDVRYLFEIPGDETDAAAIYESLLEPEVQMAEFLPRIRYSGEPDRLDRRILYFIGAGEKQAAAALRPFIDHLRRHRPALAAEADQNAH